MIFNYTRDHYLFEAVKACHLQLAEVLKVHPKNITSRIDVDEETNNRQPFFSVDPSSVPGVSEDEVNYVIKTLYEDCKEHFLLRVETGLMTRTEYLENIHGCEKNQESPHQTKSSEEEGGEEKSHQAQSPKEEGGEEKKEGPPAFEKEEVCKESRASG